MIIIQLTLNGATLIDSKYEITGSNLRESITSQNWFLLTIFLTDIWGMQTRGGVGDLARQVQ